jgi:hypothetical protein
LGCRGRVGGWQRLATSSRERFEHISSSWRDGCEPGWVAAAAALLVVVDAAAFPLPTAAAHCGLPSSRLQVVVNVNAVITNNTCELKRVKVVHSIIAIKKEYVHSVGLRR